MDWDFRRDVGEPQGEPAGQIFERSQIDPLIHLFRARLRARHGVVGHAVGDDHQRDRREDEITILDDPGHLFEERVEIGQRVVRCIPLPEITFDLVDVLPLEVVDRMERLRLVRILSADRSDEQRLRLIQASQTVQVPVNVMRQEAQRVVVVPAFLE